MWSLGLELGLYVVVMRILELVWWSRGWRQGGSSCRGCGGTLRRGLTYCWCLESVLVVYGV